MKQGRPHHKDGQIPNNKWLMEKGSRWSHGSKSVTHCRWTNLYRFGSLLEGKIDASWSYGTNSIYHIFTVWPSILLSKRSSQHHISCIVHILIIVIVTIIIFIITLDLLVFYVAWDSLNQNHQHELVNDLIIGLWKFVILSYNLLLTRHTFIRIQLIFINIRNIKIRWHLTIQDRNHDFSPL